MGKILIVEDDETIRNGLMIMLTIQGYIVDCAVDGKDAVEKFDDSYNLVVMDVLMPRMSGIDACRKMRDISNVPILFLTAKSSEIDKIQGFDAGADDYIIKPFRTRELISRANNILRRYNNIQTNIITSSNIKIDLDAQRVYKNDDEIVLTALEYKILALLFTNINQTVSREKILDKIWDIAGNYVNDNTLTVYIKRIRAKLSPNDIIKTIKGIGYRIEN